MKDDTKADQATGENVATNTEDATMTSLNTEVKSPAKKVPAKKTAKKTAKKSAKKANGKAKTARKPREGNKTQDVLAKMRTKSGITRAQILEMTGWTAVSVQQLVRAQGLDPDKDLKVSEERPFTYTLKPGK